jgi:hypothetical protein
MLALGSALGGTFPFVLLFASMKFPSGSKAGGAPSELLGLLLLPISTFMGMKFAKRIVEDKWFVTVNSFMMTIFGLIGVAFGYFLVLSFSSTVMPLFTATMLILTGTFLVSLMGAIILRRYI